MRSRPPPSSFHNGWPSAFPLMSHSATSIADIAIVKMPAGPDEPAASRSFRAIASTRNGSSPMTSAHRSSTAWRKVRVSAPPKKVTPSPSMPSSVRSLSQTIGFLAFGFSENPASGSSFGNSTMPVSSEASFMARSSLGSAAVDRLQIEFEAEAGLCRHRQFAVLLHRHLFEERHQPRHVFDRQPVRHGADQMHMHLRDQVADDRQVERLGHAGDLQPLRDAADPHEIDHRNVDRAPLKHVAERHDAPDIFAAGDG